MLACARGGPRERFWSVLREQRRRVRSPRCSPRHCDTRPGRHRAHVKPAVRPLAVSPTLLGKNRSSDKEVMAHSSTRSASSAARRKPGSGITDRGTSGGMRRPDVVVFEEATDRPRTPAPDPVTSRPKATVGGRRARGGVRYVPRDGTPSGSPARIIRGPGRATLGKLLRS